LHKKCVFFVFLDFSRELEGLELEGLELEGLICGVILGFLIGEAAKELEEAKAQVATQSGEAAKELEEAKAQLATQSEIPKIPLG